MLLAGSMIKCKIRWYSGKKDYPPKDTAILSFPVLQYIMGHFRIAVTMEVYNHVSSERERKEMDKLEK